MMRNCGWVTHTHTHTQRHTVSREIVSALTWWHVDVLEWGGTLTKKHYWKGIFFQSSLGGRTFGGRILCPFPSFPGGMLMYLNWGGITPFA